MSEGFRLFCKEASREEHEAFRKKLEDALLDNSGHYINIKYDISKFNLEAERRKYIDELNGFFEAFCVMLIIISWII